MLFECSNYSENLLNKCPNKVYSRVHDTLVNVVKYRDMFENRICAYSCICALPVLYASTYSTPYGISKVGSLSFVDTALWTIHIQNTYFNPYYYPD